MQNWVRYTLLCIFQDGGRRHLEFPKSVIFNSDETYIADIYQHIKFGAN